jgi:hypothetical protein
VFTVEDDDEEEDDRSSGKSDSEGDKEIGDHESNRHTDAEGSDAGDDPPVEGAHGPVSGACRLPELADPGEAEAPQIHGGASMNTGELVLTAALKVYHSPKHPPCHST